MIPSVKSASVLPFGSKVFYVSMLREKQWGRSSMGIAGDEELTVIDKDPHHLVRIWVELQ